MFVRNRIAGAIADLRPALHALERLRRDAGIPQIWSRAGHEPRNFPRLPLASIDTVTHMHEAYAVPCGIGVTFLLSGTFEWPHPVLSAPSGFGKQSAGKPRSRSRPQLYFLLRFIDPAPHHAPPYAPPSLARGEDDPNTARALLHRSYTYAASSVRGIKTATTITQPPGQRAQQTPAACTASAPAKP